VRAAAATSAHAADCGCTRCRGFQPGNTAAETHGAQSERRVSGRATAQKRRLLRQNGLRASDLDGLGLAHLDLAARAVAKVEILDEYSADPAHGFIDAKGEPHPAAKVYFAAINSARLALARLEAHLRARGDLEPSIVVQMQRQALGSAP
jgi:hypothetical protein